MKSINICLACKKIEEFSNFANFLGFSNKNIDLITDSYGLNAYDLISLITICETRNPGFVNQRNFEGNTLLDIFFNMYESDLESGTLIFRQIIRLGGHCRIHNKIPEIRSYIQNTLCEKIEVRISENESKFYTNFIAIKLFMNILFQDDHLDLFRKYDSLNHLYAITSKQKTDDEQQAKCFKLRIIMNECLAPRILKDFEEVSDLKKASFYTKESVIKESAIRDIRVLAESKHFLHNEEDMKISTIFSLFKLFNAVAKSESYSKPLFWELLRSNSYNIYNSYEKHKNIDLVPLKSSASIKFFANFIHHVNLDFWMCSNATVLRNSKFILHNAIEKHNNLLFQILFESYDHWSDSAIKKYIWLAVKHRNQSAYNCIISKHQDSIHHLLYYCASTAIRENDVDTLKLMFKNRAINVGYHIGYEFKSLYKFIEDKTDIAIKNVLNKYGYLSQNAMYVMWVFAAELIEVPLFFLCITPLLYYEEISTFIFVVLALSSLIYGIVGGLIITSFEPAKNCIMFIWNNALKVVNFVMQFSLEEELDYNAPETFEFGL